MEKKDKEISILDAQPVNSVQWVTRDKLNPNDYNPNSVAPRELRLLKISIKESGWTQPIVVNPDMTIVDGFHRWTVSADKDISELTGGLIPIVITRPKDHQSQMMATVRHNRARGTHSVLKMSDIVGDLVKKGLSGKEICERLQMEEEEVTRLLFTLGIPKSDIFKEMEFSKAWVPEQK